MSALRKHTASAFERATDCDELAVVGDNHRDGFAYDDDVTPEGVAFIREKAKAHLPKGNWKVIDGYVGDSATRVG